MRHILEELGWRGLVEDCTGREELARELARPVTLYCGFDPTADSLHVGNLVPLLALRRFQLAGHHPIAVAGGATGAIGDPSGKGAERALLSREEIGHNIGRIKGQLTRLLDFSEGIGNPARLLDNAGWTEELGCLDFLRDIGKHFSINMMVAKESVRARMEDRDSGISYTEFSYMILQALDFMQLQRDHGCILQIGGSDQWGNITAGIDLCRKKLGRQVHGLTLPLITNADGTKFGKTAEGAVWLDPARTSPYKFYQFWIRTADRDVIRHLRHFTFLSREEIGALERRHREAPHRRPAQKRLALEMTTLIHGRDAAWEVRQASEAFFSGDLEKLSEGALFQFMQENPNCHVFPAGKVRTLLDLAVESGLLPSRSQGRKIIMSGGMSVNNRKETDPSLPIDSSRLIHGHYLLLRKGKKDHMMLRFTESPELVR